MKRKCAVITTRKESPSHPQRNAMQEKRSCSTIRRTPRPESTFRLAKKQGTLLTNHPSASTFIPPAKLMPKPRRAAREITLYQCSPIWPGAFPVGVVVILVGLVGFFVTSLHRHRLGGFFIDHSVANCVVGVLTSNSDMTRSELVNASFVLICFTNHTKTSLRLGVLAERTRTLKVFAAISAFESAIDMGLGI
jgi:hypothetical protein